MADTLQKPNPQKTQNSNSKSPIIDGDSIPTDILIEILKRLPLVCLIRCSCVRKSWHQLITSPLFQSTHAVHQMKDPIDTDRLLLVKRSFDIQAQSGTTSKYFTYNKETNKDDTDWVNKRLEFTCPVGRNYSVVCSYDGLVCLFNFYQPKPETGPLILWNPSLRKAVVAAMPIDRPLDYTVGGFPKVCFGVGFDSCAGVYKVVRVAYCNGRGVGGGTESVLRAHVYCVSNAKWRNMGVTIVPQCIITVRWRGVCFNGVIHWICSVSVDLGNGCCVIRKSILVFKLRNDEFGEIQLPKDVLDVPNQMLRVVVVPRRGKEVLGVIHVVKSDVSLWVMEDYGVKESWVKLFSVKFPSMVKDMNVVVMSDQLVIVRLEWESDRWVYYDHSSRKIHYLTTVLLGRFDFVDMFVESVILLGQREGVLRIPQITKRRRTQSMFAEGCIGN